MIKINDKLPKCQYKYESGYPEIKFACDEPSTTNSKFCVFHDKDHYAEHEREAAERFEEKVKESIFQNKPLECIGYYLPFFNFTNLLKERSFPQPVYFSKATFYEEAYFPEATFSGDLLNATFSGLARFENTTFSKLVRFLNATFLGAAYFYKATFSEGATFTGTSFLSKAYFLNTVFTDKTVFWYTVFEQPNKVRFDYSNLSNVSFANSHITRVRFGDEIRWGGGKNGFTIIEEEWLKDKAKGKKEEDSENISLELVLSVYRNLRENYEFRLRYDDAGKFFIKEMELKRKYRETKSDNRPEIKENGWFRRHFSLTGLYYHLSRYGESISRPTLIATITVFASTLFWLTQSNPSLEPHFTSFFGDNTGAVVAVANSSSNPTTSTFVGFEKAGNATQWQKAFERSFADFLPLLPLGGDIKVGIIDYIIKIFGGALTFGLLIIAFRRKFERKYTIA